MKPRRLTLKLAFGDVRALRIIRGRHTLRIVIYDKDPAVPLIQASLTEAEQQAIRKALGPDK
jgi:hypothetical protein